MQMANNWRGNKANTGTLVSLFIMTVFSRTAIWIGTKTYDGSPDGSQDGSQDGK